MVKAVIGATLGLAVVLGASQPAGAEPIAVRYNEGVTRAFRAPPGQPATVQIVTFMPRPRLIKMLLKPGADDRMRVNEAAVLATRFTVRPQLGAFASLLVADIPDITCWIVGGEAPTFLRFEGPLYFMSHLADRLELTRRPGRDVPGLPDAAQRSQR